MNKMVLLGILLFIMMGCEGKSHVIAKIPEASGICFSKKSQTLFVANDEGKVFEISKEGKILRDKRLGNYDLEGVVCDDVAGELIFVVEGEDNLLRVNKKSLRVKKNINIKRKFKGNLVLKKDKKNGLEGIALVNNRIFVSNQSTKRYPKSDASLVLELEKSDKKKVTIKKIYDHGFTDVAGLVYHDKHLFMVSDKEDLLIKYDVENKKVLGSAKLPVFAQEGVAFDDDGNIYFANDEGSILRYKRTEFGL